MRRVTLGGGGGGQRGGCAAACEAKDGLKFGYITPRRPRGKTKASKTQSFRVKGPLAGVVIESEGSLSQTRRRLKLTESDPWGVSLSAPPH